MAMPARPPGPRELTISTTLEGIDGRSVPSSPYGPGPNPSRPRQITTLTEAWENANRQFQKTTKMRIDGPSVDMNHALEKWAAQYEIDNSDKARKKKQVLSVVQNIVDGINIVGGIVAQGVSTTFGVVGPCFNALSFVLEIPRRIKNVYDALMELFEEVENFLVRFKILKRIDDKKQLPTEMVESGCKMLVSFVEICGLSIKLLEGHSFSTTFKAVFLCSDSGVSAALTDFRRLAQALDSLTNTVALENIFDVRETTRETSVMVREGNMVINSVDRTLKSWEQMNNDDKTKRVNQSRLEKIRKQIYLKEERPPDGVPDFLEEMLPGTIAALDKCQEFREWQDASSRSGKNIFLIQGSCGSGKSRMLEALKRKLDGERRDSDRDDTSIYVAYHAFGGRINKSASSAIPFALRSMAVQVAEQSTAYAKELEAILSAEKPGNVRQEASIEKLWKTLKLSTFNVKAEEATMYLLFDGVEQENAVNVNKLLDLFVGDGAEKAREHDSLSIRTVLTIDPEKHQPNNSIPAINMDAATKDLVKIYTIKELERLDIFQSNDKKSVKWREQIIKAVQATHETPKDSQKPWNFRDVKQRLERIKLAVEKDASSEELAEILQPENAQTFNPKAKQEIKDLAQSLTIKELSQVNQLLPWLLYSEYADYMDLEELEAVLFLAHNSDSLQSLANKVKHNFQKLFHRDGNIVRLQPEIEVIFRNVEDESSYGPEAGKPLINLDMSIHNADESIVRRFVWQLNEQMSSDKFDFGTSYANTALSMISVNQLSGHVCIANTCLKLLNEGWRDETEILLVYAREFLPKHFMYLARNINQISREERINLTHNLVIFLSDPYHLTRDPDRSFGQGSYWHSDPEAAESITKWLEETHAGLQSREKRWVKNALDLSEGRLGFLKDVARAVGKKWIRPGKENAKEREWTYGVQTSNSLEFELYSWLNKFIENNGPPEGANRSTTESALRSQTGTSTDETDADKIESTQTQFEPDGPTSEDSGALQEGSQPARSHVVDEMSSGDKIRRAIGWLVENEVNFREDDGNFTINIGYTYLASGEYTDAENQFRKIIDDDKFRSQGLVGLGRTYHALERRDDAADKFRQALSSIETQKSESGLTEDQNEVLARLYRELAIIYEEPQQSRLCEIAELYEKSLQCQDDRQFRWKTLRLWCEVDRTSGSNRALDLLEKWSYYPDAIGNQALASALWHSVTDDPRCDELELLITAIRDSNMQRCIAQGLSNAIRIEESGGESPITAVLLYLEGTVIVRGSDASRWSTAVNKWTDVVRILGQNDDIDYDLGYILSKAASGIAQYHFDLSLSKLSANTGTNPSHGNDDDIVRQLAYKLPTILPRNQLSQLFYLPMIINRYLVSMNAKIGRMDEARQLSMEDMSIVLEVFSDDDGDNDTYGIRLLMNVLCALGDKVGTMTAFSLLGRKSAETSLSFSDQIRDNETATVIAEASLEAECDGCSKFIDTDDKEGYWWCQYCANIDLCPACHEQVMKGELNLRRCSPAHNFLRLYHTEYAEEEIRGNMVKIDWEWEDLGDGKFRRKGGRIVPFPEWLEELRLLWKLPKVSEGSRAQK